MFEGRTGTGSERLMHTEARLDRWLASVTNPVVIEVGVAIPTVRRFGEQFADRLIRINPTRPEIPGERGVSLPMAGIRIVAQ